MAYSVVCVINVYYVVSCNCDCCQLGCESQWCGGQCAHRRRHRQRNLQSAAAGDNDANNSSSSAASHDNNNNIEQCDDLSGFLDLLINSPEKLRMQISRYHCEVSGID